MGVIRCDVDHWLRSIRAPLLQGRQLETHKTVPLAAEVHADEADRHLFAKVAVRNAAIFELL